MIYIPNVWLKFYLKQLDLIYGYGESMSPSSIFLSLQISINHQPIAAELNAANKEPENQFGGPVHDSSRP
jgi:hypothetical protein